MSERGYSPARWNRLKHPFLDLKVPLCEDCKKGHIPPRPVCPDINSGSVLIEKEKGGDIFASEIQDKVEITST